MELYEKFYRKANSMLNGAIDLKDSKSILNEDKCYILQQALEKALKAVLVYYERSYPNTHDINRLFQLVEQCIELPGNVYAEDLVRLTIFAVERRYPDGVPEEEEMDISDEDYLFFLQRTIACFNWIKKILNL